VTTAPETKPAKPARKSRKGYWGKVGAPPKDIKFPRGSYTVKELKAANPEICDLTLRNYVTAHTCGYRDVKKLVEGKKVTVRLPVEVTIVKLAKNAVKDTVGRPNYRYMSKAAFEASAKSLAKAATTKRVKVTATAPVTETVTA
jgi:enoyl-[acyl-carrier-protein] reductase (NADH)